MTRHLVCAALLALCGCIPAEVRSMRREQLQTDLLFLRGGGGNSVILFSGRRVLLFDTKMWPWATEVDQAVRSRNVGDLLVVNSHAHEDHTLGNSLFPEATIIAAPTTTEELQRQSLSDQQPRPAGVPSVTVHDRLRLHFGRETVELVHPRAAHTAGDLYAWIPDRKVLITGDLFDSGFYPHVDPSRGGTILGYIEVLDQLSVYPSQIVIPGHGGRATGADIASLRDFLRGLQSSIATLRQQGRSDAAILETLSAPNGERLENLGSFSSRRNVIERLLAEMPRG